jgi:hypothetical protein
MQCVTGWGGDGVMWRAYTGVIHCVFDQNPNLQNWAQIDKHLPPSTFTGQFVRKADIKGLVSL